MPLGSNCFYFRKRGEGGNAAKMLFPLPSFLPPWLHSKLSHGRWVFHESTATMRHVWRAVAITHLYMYYYVVLPMQKQFLLPSCICVIVLPPPRKQASPSKRTKLALCMLRSTPVLTTSLPPPPQNSYVGKYVTRRTSCNSHMSKTHSMASMKHLCNLIAKAV